MGERERPLTQKNFPQVEPEREKEKQQRVTTKINEFFFLSDGQTRKNREREGKKSTNRGKEIKRGQMKFFSVFSKLIYLIYFTVF